MKRGNKMVAIDLPLIIVLLGLLIMLIIHVDCRHIVSPEGSRISNGLTLTGIGSGTLSSGSSPLPSGLSSQEIKHQLLMIPSQYLIRPQAIDPIERYQLLANLRRERRRFPEVGSKGFEADIFDEGFGGFSTMR